MNTSEKKDNQTPINSISQGANELLEHGFHTPNECRLYDTYIQHKKGSIDIDSIQKEFANDFEHYLEDPANLNTKYGSSDDGIKKRQKASMEIFDIEDMPERLHKLRRVLIKLKDGKTLNPSDKINLDHATTLIAQAIAGHETQALNNGSSNNKLDEYMHNNVAERLSEVNKKLGDFLEYYKKKSPEAGTGVRK